jgi:dihydrofolate reductase
MINAIFAMDAAGGLGKNGTLPWPKNTRDFRWFRSNTTGTTVVMGRNTWDDPIFPKPLKHRENIVLTSKPLPYYPHTWPIKIEDARKWFSENSDKDIFIIGGVRVLITYWDLIERFYVTTFPKDYECDVKLHKHLIDDLNKKRLLHHHKYEDLEFKILQ